MPCSRYRYGAHDAPPFPHRHHQYLVTPARKPLIPADAGVACAVQAASQDPKTDALGYEIPFNRHFYQYVPPRSLEEIDADLDKVSAEIMELLQEVHV
ncbi:MAG: hypothetical protein M3H12_15490 [Chromatiales bacterium]|nr:hypothetical protein [Gammaproteobacteria bacterium]